MSMNRPAVIDIYPDNWQHLADELSRLDLLLQLGVSRFRGPVSGEPRDAFRGLCISEQEIDDILVDKTAGPRRHDPGTKGDTGMENPVNRINRLQETISRKKTASIEGGVYLALPQLSRLFGLGPFEENCVLICLAPELDRKYEKLYGYLQDDVTRKRPSMDLILNLLCSTRQEMITGRSYFSPQALLFMSRIIGVIEEPQNPQPPLLSRPLKLDDRIVDFLLGTGSIDRRIEPFTRLVYSREGPFETAPATETVNELVSLARTHIVNSSGTPDKPVFYFHGPYGAGRQSMARHICREFEVPLLVCDIEEIIDRQLPFDETIRLVFREALLQPAAVYLEGFHRLTDGEEKYRFHLKLLARAVEEYSWLTFLSGEKNWEPAGLFHDNMVLNVEFAVPDYAARMGFWKAVTGGECRLSGEVDFGTLAGRFRFTPGQINDAFIAARNLARLRQPDTPEITMSDLYKGCRAQCNQKLGTLAQKIAPKYTWADIVLPADIMQQLHEICDQVSYRHRVYGEWGFDRKLSLGKGLNALFSGPSGTGKTMAAEVIASDLQLDLYRIDLSSVVSKYIGETEKNLGRVFQEAESSNAILFFDEADALFGRRSEVKDAHDRYANIEIGYLLQKMEEYEGISILATNLKKNMDDAFLRRLHFLVEFPFPDAAYRCRIWKSIFPGETPLSGDIDFDLIATRFKIAGGNIKNIVVNAAFLAAGNSQVVDMEHIIRAAKQEYRKAGMPYSKADFEK